MNGYRNWIRKTGAAILCAVFLLSCLVPAYAEETPATPTDLAEVTEAPEEETLFEDGDVSEEETPEEAPEPDEEPPFVQTLTAEGVRITVTADPGVFSADAELTVELTEDETFARAAEAALGVTPGSSGIVLHRIYLFSGAEMNGSARVTMERLGLKELQAKYPGAEISVFVLTGQGDRAQKTDADVNIARDSAAFLLASPGAVDLLTLVQRPAEPEPEEEKEEEQPDDRPEEPVQEWDERLTGDLSGAAPAAQSGAGEEPELLFDEEQGVLAAGTDPDDKVAAFVTRCYWLVLGRQPEAQGLGHWTELLKSRQLTAAEVISGFLNSLEYQSKHKPAADLVEIMYRTMLNRASDESGRRNWLQVIANGATMNGLISGFSNSQEFKELCESYGIESGTLTNNGGEPAAYNEKLVAFVTRCYREALNREPEDEGLYSWCRALTLKQMTYKQAAEGFVFSPELTGRQLSNAEFVKVLYRLYLGRGADPEGLQNWVQMLDSGATREQVSEGFANSAEFAQIIMEYDPSGAREPEFTFILSPGDNLITVKNGASVTVQPSPEMGAPAGLRWTSSDSNIFTVSDDGEIFGVYPGQAVLTISGPDGSVFLQISVIVHANYRAVLFSESTFAGGEIKRNRGDVKLMKQMLGSVTGPDGGSYVVFDFDDLVADDVYRKIDELLIAPSRDGDVSMFFFASHGDYKSTDDTNAGRLYCKNKQSWLLLQDLAARLSRVSGKVIVLLESCGPGAALRPLSNASQGGTAAAGSRDETEEMTDDPAFTRAIIDAFSAADHGLSVYRSAGTGTYDPGAEQGVMGTNLFLTEKFIVMVAAAYLQASYSVGTDTSNLFPNKLVQGVGFSGRMPADVEFGNGDNRLTVNELFQYVYKYTKHKQTPDVYPRNCEYELFVR